MNNDKILEFSRKGKEAISADVRRELRNKTLKEMYNAEREANASSRTAQRRLSREKRRELYASFDI